MITRLRRADIDIMFYDRHTFFTEVFDYAPGDHSTFLAPSGGGKTWIAFEALAHTASPELQATVFVMKPKDGTVTKFAKQNGYEIVRDWPPSTARIARGRIFGKKPPGYVLWPRDTGQPEYDDMRQEIIFRKAIRMMYNDAKKKPNIEFVDETYSLENELHLRDDLRRVWTKGRSIGCGLWAASQRPAYISAWAYQAQHLFLGFDPDRKAQDRFGEIGAGIDPAIIRALIQGLKRYEFLYISREERAMCIIASH